MTQPPPSVVRVYTYEGDPLDVSPGDAESLIRAHKATFAKDQVVPVYDQASGELRPVAATEALSRIRSDGDRLAAPGEYTHQEEAKAYNTLPMRAQSAGLGLTNMVGAGYGEAALVGAGRLIGGDEKAREVAETIRKQREYNPWSHGAGEAAGFVLPALMSGGGSIAARGGLAGAAEVAGRGLTVLPRGAAALGEGAGALTARGLARVGIAEGGIASRALSSAAGQAVEMGIYGAGEATSRAVIRNPDLTGEEIMAAAGHGLAHGALFGALGGGVLGGGGAVLSAGATRAYEAGAGLVRGAADRASALVAQGAERLPGLVEKGVEKGTELLHTGLDKATGLAERFNGRVSPRTATTLEEKFDKLADAAAPGGLARYAERKTLKGTGGNQPLLEKAEAMSPGLQTTMARQLQEDIQKVLGREPNTVLSHLDQAKGAGLLKEQIGKQKGALIDEMMHAKVKVDAVEIARQIRREVAPLRNSLLDESIAAAAEGERIAERLETSLRRASPRKLWGEQRKLGDQINWARIRKGDGTISDHMQADIYFRLGKALQETGEKAEGVGADFAARWQKVNHEYTAADMVTKLTEKGKAKDLANRTFGASEMVGYLSGGLPGAIVQHGIKRYGDQYVAAVATRMAKGEHFLSAASNTLQKSLGEGVVNFIKHGAGEAKALGQRVLTEGKRVATETIDAGKQRALATLERGRQAGTRALETGARYGGRAVRGAELTTSELEQRRTRQEPLPQRYQRAAAAVTAAGAGQEARNRQIAAALGPHAPPGVVAAAQATSARATQLALSKLPPAQASAQTLTPHLERPTPSPAEMSKFLRTMRAIEDPSTVVDSLHRGTLSPEEAEALRTVYPEMFADVQRQMQQALAERTTPLPYEHALLLGTLLGVPAHGSLDPKFIAAQQAALHQGGPPQGKGPSAGAGAAPKRQIKMSKSFDLDTQEPTR